MNIKQILFFVVAVLLFSMETFAQRQFNLSSPDGRVTVKVEVGDDIKWSASLDGKPVILPGSVSMAVNKDILGKKPVLLSQSRRQINNRITVDVPRKNKTEQDLCNELLLQFKNNYSLIFRAYNEGAAYRFETKYKNEVLVENEDVNLSFNPGSQVFFPEEESIISHYERSYIDTALASLSLGRFCSLPVLVTSGGVRVLVTEADLFDYPNLFLSATAGNSLAAKFPPVLLQADPGKRPDRDEKIVKEADYIARTSGTRTFPWRVFTITDDDRKLAESDMVFKLSRPVAINDTKWIKPGKVAWDWWNANNIYGVDFEAGLNTATYKYYIDFAAKYGLEYIILDEGWSKTTTDLTAPNPDINLEELISYGKSKGVGVILWMLWKPLDQNMEKHLDQFVKWGAKGIKVDFMQRADQYMVNYYERVARECAKRQLLVDFHGAFKPSGLHRAYPNVMSYEGLKGAENNKWGKLITPDHNLTLPFIRMVAGAMDYTPGAMINANKVSFRDIFDNPMSMGTRCHQFAMYVVYESPLQMLADNPTHYYKEPESTEFISKMPVTWDETRVLDAKVSDYILVARRKGAKWYAGAMTDWTPRTLTLDCSFLPPGNYKIEMMQDGVNAGRNGNDYKKVVQKITNGSKLVLNLAAGGGWAGIIEKAD
ncbi:alpha-glucosidase [Arcticibacter tournemirensis]|uniref:Glycoside hydrolase family 97 protein n=1 Tax=Arcticibacter tournemirensis TaxID=699437 RepID=A0A5M9H9P3_9SPHI|nr:glycoside hydrolase family 97 protein [Arcticibacter tournemirensis]KAA8483089.1 glycoside hydrolase family 97 protein [Arcticibacter tournemirensis]TQM51998.1 alpha-glucosidase [Arcticibacter tournemirensis]